MIKKELDSLTTIGEKIIFQLYIGAGQELELWDEYSSLITHKRSRVPKSTGWTSWYYHYAKITEKIITDNLEALSKAEIPIEYSCFCLTFLFDYANINKIFIVTGQDREE